MAEPKPAPAEPDESMLGTVGESCRARSDCRRGLKCIKQECVDERQGQSCQASQDCGEHLRCIREVCTAPGMSVAPGGRQQGGEDAPPQEPSTELPGEPWEAFRFNDGDVHPFVGLGVGLGTAMVVAGSQLGDAPFNISIPVQGGIAVGIHEASLELGPFFYDPNVVAFQMNGAYAVQIPLTEHFSYPLRAGVGFAAGNGTVFQTRVEVLGFAYNYGHLRVDVKLPSVRWFTDFDFHYVAFQGGTTVSYAF